MTEVFGLGDEVVERADIGIALLDTDGKVLIWNAWLRRHSGIDKARACGRSIEELFPQTARMRIRFAIADCLAKGTSSLLSNALNQRTFPLVSEDEARTPVEQMILLKPVATPDGTRRCLLQIFDVTNSVRRENLLREKTVEANRSRELAESVSRLKSEFVSTVSHELRTPLTAIKGSLQLIQGGAVGEVAEQVASLIDIANNNTTRLLRLINDLLDMEKIEAGKMGFEFKPVELGELLAATLESNRHFASQHKIEYRLITREHETWVTADPVRLGQVITNLLSNAAKFSSEGENVDVSVTRLAGNARVAISNRGGGIRDDQREQIFDKFTQLDASDSRRVPGSGLGLSISKAIIEQHGGHIDFDSVPGEVTTFYFDLPLCERLE